LCTEIYKAQIGKLRGTHKNDKNPGSYQYPNIHFKPQENKADHHDKYASNIKDSFNLLASFLVRNFHDF